MINDQLTGQKQRVHYINKEIKHVMQCTKNDCGVACIKMAWQWLGIELSELDDILTTLSIKNFSLWTIDIAHICAIKKLKHTMYTITLGVQESYFKDLEFYSKERDFNFEKNRISSLFRNASNLGS
jgi:hypothetical protein